MIQTVSSGVGGPELAAIAEDPRLDSGEASFSIEDTADEMPTDERSGKGPSDELGWTPVLPSRPRPVRRESEVVVLLPALNEEGAIGEVIDRIPFRGLHARGHDVSVWVVDGQSTDQTMDVARARGARTFVQNGTGKGNGVRQAFDHILATPGAAERRVFVMLDADGTYPVEEIPRFVAAVEGGGDIVLGSRLRGSIEAGAMSGMNRFGNRLLSALASFLFHAPVTDVCTGMWAFREEALRGLGLVARGFDLEADLFASACERGVEVRELPIDYSCRIGEPKLIPLRTGLAIAWHLLSRRLNPPATEPTRTLPPPARAQEEAA